MSKLSREDWLETKPPYYWLRTTYLHDKETVVKDMVAKWLDENMSGWWYSDQNVFIFSNPEDRTAFKLWILTEAFDNDYGEIESGG